MYGVIKVILVFLFRGGFSYYGMSVGFLIGVKMVVGQDVVFVSDVLVYYIFDILVKQDGMFFILVVIGSFCWKFLEVYVLLSFDEMIKDVYLELVFF